MWTRPPGAGGSTTFAARSGEAARPGRARRATSVRDTRGEAHSRPEPRRSPTMSLSRRRATSRGLLIACCPRLGPVSGRPEGTSRRRLRTHTSSATAADGGNRGYWSETAPARRSVPRTPSWARAEVMGGAPSNVDRPAPRSRSRRMRISTLPERAELRTRLPRAREVCVALVILDGHSTARRLGVQRGCHERATSRASRSRSSPRLPRLVGARLGASEASGRRARRASPSGAANAHLGFGKRLVLRSGLSAAGEACSETRARSTVGLGRRRGSRSARVFDRRRCDSRGARGRPPPARAGADVGAGRAASGRLPARRGVPGARCAERRRAQVRGGSPHLRRLPAGRSADLPADQFGRSETDDLDPAADGPSIASAGAFRARTERKSVRHRPASTVPATTRPPGAHPQSGGHHGEAPNRIGGVPS
jgi:hypothetical protein